MPEAAAALIGLLLAVAGFVLQIALIVAVFRTSKATQDTAWLLRKAMRELQDIADNTRPVQAPPLSPAQQAWYGQEGR